MAIIIEGVEKLNLALRKAEARAPEAMAAALYSEAHAIMAVSKTQTPVDQGILRASGDVALPEILGPLVSVEFGYGGAASEYALVQHEHMDYHHTSGGPKFLERPTLEAALGMGTRLAGRVRRFMGW